jgi:hypothetical protein
MRDAANVGKIEVVLRCASRVVGNRRLDTWCKRFTVYHRVLGLVHSFFLAIFPREKVESSLP